MTLFAIITVEKAIQYSYIHCGFKIDGIYVYGPDVQRFDNMHSKNVKYAFKVEFIVINESGKNSI